MWVLETEPESPAGTASALKSWTSLQSHLPGFLMMVTLTGMRWCLIVILFQWSLVMLSLVFYTFGHFFVFFGKMFLVLFFKNRINVCYWFLGVLYILDINLFSNIATHVFFTVSATFWHCCFSPLLWRSSLVQHSLSVYTLLTLLVTGFYFFVIAKANGKKIFWFSL